MRDGEDRFGEPRIPRVAAQKVARFDRFDPAADRGVVPAPSGSSMSLTSALARRRNDDASRTSVCASTVASATVRMNAPLPALTSNTIASAPPAIFFETIDAAMSPTDGTVPVRSRRL